jgi:hypothetical protein
MGIFSSSKARAGATKGDIKKALKLIDTRYASSRGDLFRIAPTAFQNRLQGMNAATSLFQQSVQPQMGAFQQGNIGAQETYLSGLPQQINAILGQPIDLGGLQAKGLPTDLSFLTEAKMPEFDMSALLTDPQAPP